MVKTAGRVIMYVFLIVALILYLFPIYLIVINSFKPFKDMFESCLAFPKSLYLDNYITAFSSSGFIRRLFNNIVLTFMTVAGVLLVTSMAGYKLSRVKSKLSKFLYLLYTVPFLIPFYTYMIPLVQLITKMKLMNTLSGVALISISSSSFAFFMFHGFVKTIPVELDESARIDGCGEFRIYTRIIVPLLKPIMSSVAVLYAIWTWNDFLLPFLILNNPEKQTVTIAVYQMFGKFGSDWDVITATLVLASLPMVILYIVLQKYVISGIVAGAMKG
ncbi:MAG: carbohydrate ABC transporter permease [Clostridiaceae bacterium]|nr:carbohydrate ABC transporter permease [Clostridiaceae bacterium]